jgi:hypothetical protein
VNTLSAEDDATSSTELAYFNFLKPAGFWLDLSIFPRNAALEHEAISVGASVVSGARVLAATDCLWAKTVFGLTLDADVYASRLTAP